MRQRREIGPYSRQRGRLVRRGLRLLCPQYACHLRGGIGAPIAAQIVRELRGLGHRGARRQYRDRLRLVLSHPRGGGKDLRYCGELSRKLLALAFRRVPRAESRRRNVQRMTIGRPEETY